MQGRVLLKRHPQARSQATGTRGTGLPLACSTDHRDSAVYLATQFLPCRPSHEGSEDAAGAAHAAPTSDLAGAVYSLPAAPHGCRQVRYRVSPKSTLRGTVANTSDQARTDAEAKEATARVVQGVTQKVTKAT